MCDTNDNHTHARIEEWITPADSKHLSAKMIHLFPGDEIPVHTTGPNREEILIVLYGSVTLTYWRGEIMHKSTIGSGETLFIPPETPHAVQCSEESPAQYAYCATKRKAG